MSLIPQLTDAGKGLLISALSGSTLRFSQIKIGNGTVPDEPRADDYWYDTDDAVLRRYSEDWTESERKITCGSAEPEAPSYNDLWYNTATGTLYYYGDGWGICYTPITCGTTEPMYATHGDYWYDTANEVLYTYGYKWITETSEEIIAASEAPEAPSAGDHWIDSTNAQLMVYALLRAAKQGVVITPAEIAPATPAVGDYWYDTVNFALKIAAREWQEKTGITITATDSEPENPANGDYWYDTAGAVLKKYSETEWADDAQPFSYGDTAPDSADAGDWWYDSTTSTIKEYALVWQLDETHTITHGDTIPESPEDGDWWYNTTGDVLMEYGYGWKVDTEHVFTYSMTAPAAPNAGDWWYDNTLHVYAQDWVTVSETTKPFHYGSASPSLPAAGDWWYDSANSVLHEYGMLWQRDTGDVFTYADSPPAHNYDGSLWYDTANNKLMLYATGWIDDTARTFTYSAVAPISPDAGDWWYNSGQLQLYECNGVQWITNNTTITCSASAPATQDALTDLVNPMVSIAITGITRGTNYVSISGAFDNSEITETFRWTETGIFATDEDGNELLYAYCYSGEDYETIPSNDCGKTIGINLTLLVMVGDAENVTAVIGEGALYATKEALEQHKGNFNNPHGVTAEQIGLGKVPNVAPADMVIDGIEPEELSEPAAGDVLSVVLGKVKKAISTLIYHVKATNPHGITPGGIGAASSSHVHTGMPVFGVYTGNGQRKRKIDIGFTPSALILCDSRGMMGDDIYGGCGGICIGAHGLRAENGGNVSCATTWNDTYTAALITAGGFYVNQTGHGGVQTNTTGETYRYIAFR